MKNPMKTYINGITFFKPMNEPILTPVFSMDRHYGGVVIVPVFPSKAVLVSFTGKAARKILSVTDMIDSVRSIIRRLHHNANYRFDFECVQTHIGPFSIESDDESRMDWSIVHIDNDWAEYAREDYDVWEYLHDQIDTYCQHEYDCCGHWYQGLYSHRSRHLFGDYYLLVIGSSRNV